MKKKKRHVCSVFDTARRILSPARRHVETVYEHHFNGRKVRKSRFAKICCSEVIEHYGCLLVDEWTLRILNRKQDGEDFSVIEGQSHCFWTLHLCFVFSRFSFVGERVSVPKDIQWYIVEIRFELSRKNFEMSNDALWIANERLLSSQMQ